MGKGFSNYRKSVLGSSGGGIPNMQKLMEQAKQMQESMEKAKEEIKNAEFEGSSGGDLVKVKVNGESRLISLSISPSAVDTEDLEMLEDLIIAAYNDAEKKADEFCKETMPEGTEGLI